MDNKKIEPLKNDLCVVNTEDNMQGLYFRCEKLPGQIESIVKQDFDHARKGMCEVTVTFLAYMGEVVHE